MPAPGEGHGQVRVAFETIGKIADGEHKGRKARALVSVGEDPDVHEARLWLYVDVKGVGIVEPFEDAMVASISPRRGRQGQAIIRLETGESITFGPPPCACVMGKILHVPVLGGAAYKRVRLPDWLEET